MVGILSLPDTFRCTCPCGTPMLQIGEEISEQLDLVPMQVQEAQAEPPVALVVDQVYQPVSNDSVFRVEFGAIAIAIAGLVNAKYLAGQSYCG